MIQHLIPNRCQTNIISMWNVHVVGVTIRNLSLMGLIVIWNIELNLPLGSVSGYFPSSLTTTTLDKTRFNEVRCLHKEKSQTRLRHISLY